MMDKKTVRDVDVAGRRVLLRVDFNVPLDKQTHEVADDTRIRAAIPTIQYLRGQGAKVILCSHLGRPGGKVVEDLRLRPVAEHLSALLEAPVLTAADCIGPEVEAAVANLQPGGLLMLENLRFHPEEERNDPEFARKLAALADIYVNDAFGAAHRAHASTEGVAHYIPAVAGFLMEQEIIHLGKVLHNPEHPFAAIIGGAKISGKIDVLRNLLDKVDTLLVGGGMANTFLLAKGIAVGDSLVEEEQLATAREVLDRCEDGHPGLLLPVDAVIADQFSADATARTITLASEQVPDGWRIMDIGPETVHRFAAALQDCRTVVWNGPMGVFEFPRFAQGTIDLARAVGDLRATTVVGGGETVQAVEVAKVADRLTHVSTGGGASLEFLEGKTLPGVAALQDR